MTYSAIQPEDMDKNRDLYDAIEAILKRIGSGGDFVLRELSPTEEKAVALLLKYSAVVQATRVKPNMIFPGENFTEMLELGPEKYINLAEKLSPPMALRSWKIPYSKLIIPVIFGAAIGGIVASAIAWSIGCA